MNRHPRLLTRALPVAALAVAGLTLAAPAAQALPADFTVTDDNLTVQQLDEIVEFLVATDASDEASIKAVMPLVDLILIVADSDKDGFFTAYAKELNKPLLVAKDALGVGAALVEYK